MARLTAQQLRKMKTVSILFLILSVGCVSGPYSTKNSAPKAPEVKSYREVLLDSIVVALEYLEIEAQAIQPARKKCSTLVEQYFDETRVMRFSEIPEALRKATLDAHRVYHSVNERAVVVTDIVKQYTAGLAWYSDLTKMDTINRILDLTILRVTTAKRNFEYCNSNWQVIKEHAD